MSKTFADKLSSTRRQYRQLKRGRFSSRQITKEELENLPSNEKIYSRKRQHRYFPINFRFLYNFLQGNVNKDWDTVYSFMCKHVPNKHQRQSLNYFSIKDGVVHVAEDGTLNSCGRLYSLDFLISPDGKLTSVKDWVIDSPPFTPRYKTTPTTSRIYKRPLDKLVELTKHESYLIQYKSVWYLAEPGFLLCLDFAQQTQYKYQFMWTDYAARKNDWLGYKVIKQLNKKDLKKYKEKGLIT